MTPASALLLFVALLSAALAALLSLGDGVIAALAGYFGLTSSGALLLAWEF
jgi:hypothetical protein